MDYSHFKRRILVTGGAGFIGSNLLLHMVPKYADYLFVNYDKLTYAGNLLNLVEIENAPNYRFEKADICDFERLKRCFADYGIHAVIHLAAESHVDRSITGPSDFINTNINGTFNLLEMARKTREVTGDFRFHHVSTDEVFGSLGTRGYYTVPAQFSVFGLQGGQRSSRSGLSHHIRSRCRDYELQQ
jgi:dTDP-glucose 4,6-dehydratase